MLEATTANSMITPIVTGLVVGAGTFVTQVLNHRRGQKRDTAGSSVLARIEKKIDDNHLEIRKTCEVLSERIDQAQSDATEALSHAIGPDGKNGLRSRVDVLEKWQEGETLRERNRLEQLERERELELRLGPAERRKSMPTDVGSLTPRTV